MTYSAQIFVAIEYTRDKPNENGQKKRVFKPVIIRESSSPSSYEQYTRHHHTSSIRVYTSSIRVSYEQYMRYCLKERGAIASSNQLPF